MTIVEPTNRTSLVGKVCFGKQSARQFPGALIIRLAGIGLNGEPENTCQLNVCFLVNLTNANLATVVWKSGKFSAEAL